MNSSVRNILFTSVTALTVTLVAAACISRDKETRNISCNDIELEFEDTLKFTPGEQIKGLIRSSCGEMLGKNINEIDLARIEDILGKKSCIREAQAWVTLDGKLHLRISHRRPEVKFTGSDGRGFYSDAEGNLFPVTGGYEPEAPQVRLSGQYPGKEWTGKLLEFLDCVDRTKAWRGRLTGIEADGKGGLSFRVDGKSVLFIFGRPEKFKEKFGKIDTYFNVIAPGHDYKRVKLGYEGQIICK